METIEAEQKQFRAEREKKLRAYLGFSLKSNAIALGVDGIEALKKGVCLLIADEAIGETSKKRMIAASARLRCPLCLYSGNIGELLGKPAVKAAALKDKNLAKAAETVIREDENWNIYSGGEI